MSRTAVRPSFETLADMLEQLGEIDPSRVRADIPPGRGTERDLIRLRERTGRLYELVDGILVEKALGIRESFLAVWLTHLLQSFAQQELGFFLGADGAVRLLARLVRVPDISFISWDRLPVRGQVPDEPIASVVPDLAVEVLSRRNTAAEMRRKLKEYFLADVRLVWFVNPRTRTVQVFTAPDKSVTLTETDVLGGEDVLPGLSLPVKSIFEQLGPTPEQKTTSTGKTKAPRKQTRGKKRTT
ncbi:MAG: Uma2 family endonuclease [Planctomycetes bacterium]|nr:Uma2 family endonuclease [Planctomycetota bacterium]